MKMIRASILFVFGFGASLNLCQAQNSYGTILGVVHDQGGLAINNASIEVRNTATAVVTIVQTQSDGNYTAINLIPGLYVVSTEVKGFAKAVTTPTALVVNQNLRIDLVLHPGTVTDTVQVSAQGALIDTDSSAISHEISNQQVTDLPIAVRNFMGLTSLVPGAVNGTSLGGPNSAYRSSFAGGELFIGGGRGSSNAYLLDGVDDNDSAFGTPTITPSIEATQDFRILSKDYSVEFGGSSAQVNVATKSGANNFHGSIYDFLQNDALNATDYFSVKDPVTGKSKPVVRYNLFGAAVGGPVWIPKIFDGRNKLFFFANYEGLRSHTLSSGLGRFPTTQELSGDFSADATIYNPATGLPFPGNKITTIDPKATQIINANLIPTPNTNALPGINVVKTLSNLDNIDQYNIRIDTRLGQKDSLFVRFSSSQENRDRPSVAPYGGIIDQQGGKNVAVDYTHAFTTNFINDLRFGLNRPIALESQEGANTNNIAGELFQGVGTDPITWGAPYLGFSGYSVVGGSTNGPLDFTTTDTKLSDMVTWTHGPHPIQGGVTFGKYFFKEINTYLSRGIILWEGFYTAGPLNPSGNAVADFLLGDSYLAEVNQGTGAAWLNSWNGSGFIEDSWKVSPRLTLNLGIRYDYNAPFQEEHDRWSGVDFAYPLGRFITPNAPIAAQINSPLLGVTTGRGLTPSDKNDWSPRVGFSYRPFVNTVIRSGYGIFYDSVELNEYIFNSLNTPFAKTYAAVGSLTQSVPIDNLFPVAATPIPVAGTMSALTLGGNMRTPYVQQWNLDIEHELPGNMVFEVGYIGSQASKLQDRRTASQGQLITPGPNPVINFPYSNFSSILETEHGASSNYNALIARFQKNYSHGFSFISHYTYSKGMGTMSDLSSLGVNPSGGYMNAWNKRADYGPLGYDVTHRFVLSPIYELPFGRGKALGANASSIENVLIGGWQVSAIYQAQTGFPFSVTGIDASGTNSPYPRVNVVGNPKAKDPVDPTRVFNRYAFAQPTTGTFGNSGNNSIRGLGLTNTDFTLIKNTAIHESLKFQLRSDFLNLFNQRDEGPIPNQNFDLSATSPFGTYSSLAHQARIVQVAAKIIF